MTGAEIKALSTPELVSAVKAAEREMVGLRFKLSMSKLENTAEIRNLRKRVARIRTEIRTREIAGTLPKDHLFEEHRPVAAEAASPAAAPQAPVKGGFLQGIVDRLTGKE